MRPQIFDSRSYIKAIKLLDEHFVSKPRKMENPKIDIDEFFNFENDFDDEEFEDFDMFDKKKLRLMKSKNKT